MCLDLETALPYWGNVCHCPGYRVVFSDKVKLIVIWVNVRGYLKLDFFLRVNMMANEAVAGDSLGLLVLYSQYLTVGGRTYASYLRYPRSPPHEISVPAFQAKDMHGTYSLPA